MRHPSIAVISDVHLGTEQCMAAELNGYLDQVRPETLIVNGDLVDMTGHNPRAWDHAQFGVVERLLNLASTGTTVYYVTGNHDHLLRHCSGLMLGKVHLLDHLELELHGKRHLVTHGDIFDLVTCSRPLVRHIGGWAYERLVRWGNLANRLRACAGLTPFSLASFIKRHVAGDKYVNRFAAGAVEHAARHGYDAIICGHIHAPSDTVYMLDGRPVHYLNSGDWVEHASVLEYDAGAWRLRRVPRLSPTPSRRRLPRHTEPSVVIPQAA